ncbi:MAG: hypothetical protein WKI48_03130, partial [Aquificaceae bacterium]
RLEMENSSLKEKVEKLTEYIGNVEQASRNKDQIISSLSQELSSYRRLLMALIMLILLLLLIILYLSLQ